METSFVVRGVVRDGRGLPVAGQPVQVVDRDLRSEQELGRGTTDDAGRYRVEYGRVSFVRAERANADLVVRVLDADGQVMVETPVRFNAGVDEIIDVALPTRIGSEFARITADCLPVLQPEGVAPAAVTDADITFLTGETGWDASRVRLWSQADRLAGDSGFSQEFWYGITRMGLPGDLTAIVGTPPSAVRDAVTRAVDRGVIAGSVLKDLDGWLAKLRARAVDALSGGSADVLTAALPDDKVRRVVAEHWYETGGDPDRLLPRLEQAKAVDAYRLSVLRAGFTLSPIVGTDPALLGAVLGRVGARTEQVAAFDAAQWRELVETAGAAVPPEVAALGGDDPLGVYAGLLERGASAAYPQPALVARLAGSRLPGGDALAALFGQRPELDLTSLDPGGLGLDETTAGRLAGLARVFRVSSEFRHVEALLTLGMDSAYAISRLSRDAFVARVAGALDPAEAVAVHRRAVDVHATALGLLSRYRQDLNALGPAAVPGPRPAGDVPPQWARLFGSVDLCDCPDCRSVLSPGAYLVDLLHFLADGQGTAPLDELLARRPDLARLELSCPNTNTVLPVIDLVNELCESRITGAPAPTASRRPAEELALTPEYVDDAAYAELSARAHPAPLPLDRPWEELRTHLDALGLPRWRLIKLLYAPDPAPVLRAALDRLGLAPAEHDLVTGAAVESGRLRPEQLWGLGADWLDALSYGDRFLRAADLAYDEMEALLATRFATDGAAPRVVPACSLDQVRVEGLDAPLLVRLHGFLRLRRALGWSIPTLDTVLSALGTGTLDDTALVELADVRSLGERLQVAPEVPAGWWTAAGDDARHALAQALSSSPADLAVAARLAGVPGDGVLGLAATRRLVDLVDQVRGWSLTVRDVGELVTDVWTGRLADADARTRLLADVQRAVADTDGGADSVREAVARRAAGSLGTSPAILDASLSALPSVAAALTGGNAESGSRALVVLAKTARLAGVLSLAPGDLALVCGQGPAGWFTCADLPATAAAGGSAADADLRFDRFTAVAEFFTRRRRRQRTGTSWTGLLAEAATASTADALTEPVAATLGASASDVNRLRASLGLSDLAAYRDGRALLALDAAVEAITEAGVPVDTALSWTEETVTPDAARGAVAALRATVPAGRWPDVERPLRDRLRERQRDALVAALAVPSGDPQDLSDDLLIDVEMAACQVTSRIQSAIATVQTFVERCLLGQEAGPALGADAVAQWQWMKTYRVWEANRKIFLYPENYLHPQLREDKTPFFADLEHDLAKGELTPDRTEAALAAYVQNVDSVARLQVCGLYHEQRTDLSGITVDRLHVVARSAGAPAVYWYRVREDGWRWTGWERLDLDIDAEEIVVTVAEERLYLCWPVVEEKGDRATAPAPPPLPTYGPDQQPSDHHAPAAAPPQPTSYLEVTLAYSRREHDGWSAKQTSQGAVRLERTQVVADPSGSVQVRFNLGWGDDVAFDVPWSAGTYETTVTVPLLGSLPVAVTGQGTTRRVTVGGSAGFHSAFDVHVDEPTTIVVIGKHDIRLVAEQVASAETTRPQDAVSLVVRCHVRYAAGGYGRVGLAEGEFRLGGCHGGFTARQFAGGPQPVIVVPEFTELAAHGGDGEQNVEPPGLPVRMIEPGDGDFPRQITPDRVNELTVSGRQLLNAQTGLGLPSADPMHARYRLVLPQGGQFFFDGPFAYEDARQSFLIEPVRVPSTGLRTGTVPVAAVAAARQKSIGATLGGGADVALDTARAITLGAGEPRAAAGALLDLTAFYATEQKFRVWSFQHPYTCRFLAALRRDGVDGLLQRVNQLPDDPPGLDFARQYQPEPIVDPRYPAETVDFSPDGAYALYNWELFVHAPLLIAQRLHADQQYEQAQRWLHYIFDPTAGGGDAAPARYWNVEPFHAAATLDPVDELRTLLADRTRLDRQVQDWRRNPFLPWRVAGLRRTAVQKAVVMSYLDLLIDWADSLFRQYTRETIGESVQLYFSAARILGPRPVRLPGTEPAVETFASLRDRLDAFSNAVVAVETAIPGGHDGVPATTDPAALRALGTSFYFCIPPNDRLLSYWDTVADRLFKIRHCQDIDGNVRDLPLFEPPIDPDLLVQAAATGLDLATVTAPAALPPYRFTMALAKALELCGEARTLGAALTGAMERRDAEELVRLRSTHELTMLAAVRDVRLAQIDEAHQAKTALERSRDIAAARGDHYQRLITDGLTEAEQAQLASLFATLVLQGGAGALDLAASVANYVPTAQFGVAGFGGSPLTTITYGGGNVGSGLAAAGRALQSVAGMLGTVSSLSGTIAGQERRLQEWRLQADLAAKEAAQLDAQVAAADIRIALAEKELADHDLRTAQSREVDQVLRSKFTNAELYDWTADQLSALYFAAYRLAYDAALKAQECFRYEQPAATAQSFITPGYWDTRYAGLLAGERLTADLRRMEAAFLSANTREHELVKQISLATLDPLALVGLRTSGSCTFALPETLFDADHPGHLVRRIKSVNLTLPAVIGPYTSVNANLTLVSARTRLLGGSWREDLRGQTVIATSSGNSDTGMFELNFRDERYLPFEGAGVVSTWQLDLDPDCNDFDVQTLSDVIVELHYTARDGGDTNAAKNAVRTARAGAQTRLLSARADFADAWYDFLHPMTDQPGQTLRLTLDAAMFGHRAQQSTVTVANVQLALVLGPAAQSGFPGLDLDMTGARHHIAAVPEGHAVTGLVEIPMTPPAPPGQIEITVPQATIDALPPGLQDGAHLDPDAIADLLVLVTYTNT